MQRRKFLKIGGAAIGLAAGGWLSVDVAREWIYQDDWIYRLTGLPKDNVRIQQFCKRCAEIVSPGNFGFKVDVSRMKKLSQGEFKELVANSIQSDYRSDRLLNVQGWILSRTEVELFAIGYSS